MIQPIVLLCLPFLLSAVRVGPIRSYMGEVRRLQATNSTEGAYDSKFNSVNSTNAITMGFIRVDTFDWLRDVWIQAMILPIGVCFKEGSKGGSAQISRILLDKTNIVRVSNVYSLPDCTGSSEPVVYLQPLKETVNQLEVVISHVSELAQALQLNPPSLDGLIIS